MTCKPPIKWVGGKRTLADRIISNIPGKCQRYIEPFVGGGAVFFKLNEDSFNEFIINDLNSELINFYKTLKDNPGELIKCLHFHKKYHSENYYYFVRGLDRKSFYNIYPNVLKSARLFYMNRVGFNGLYRVNSKGRNNVPWGKRDSFNFDEDDLLKCSHKLQECQILNSNFNGISIDKNDFWYLDPPYVPVKHDSFVSYTKNGFDMEDQKKLFNFCTHLDASGAYFQLSNSSSPVIYELYQEFNIAEVMMGRNINSNGSGRGKVKEVLISNY